MKISGGLTEDGVVVGNAYDKYGSRNPIVRHLMDGFGSALASLVARAAPREIHEVGCGEGYWTLRWLEEGFDARGTDFSSHAISLARANAVDRNLRAAFNQASIYDLRPEGDAADLIVCCEVLEHLERPREALDLLTRLVRRHLIISVPREPLWRILNIARGKYIVALGNTPGHIQHWSRRDFTQLVSEYFEVLHVRAPVPWTMILARSMT